MDYFLLWFRPIWYLCSANQTKNDMGKDNKMKKYNYFSLILDIRMILTK